MRRTMFAAALLTAFAAAAGARQKPPEPPKPGAEQKNLAIFAGNWKMEGKVEASPLGPAGTMTGTESCRMLDGGWHLVCESTGTGPWGSMKGYSILTYDRASKQYRIFAVNSAMPDADMSTGVKKGSTWTWTSKMDMGGGKTLHSRFVVIEKSPTLHAYTWEMSEDGKTWTKAMTGMSTKTGS